MRDSLEKSDGRVGEMLQDFVGETQSELFDSREECAQFYADPENFERLKKGEIGDNLMYKYRVIAGFWMWPEICSLAAQASRELLIERGVESEISDFQDFWEDFTLFVQNRHTHGTSREEVLSTTDQALRYDIAAWIKAGMPHEVEAYRLVAPAAFRFALSEDAAREVSHLVDVWSMSLKGLTKGITRMRSTALERRCNRVADDSHHSSDEDTARLPLD